ncbi:hypothetical protein GBA52_025037 [Prunus armeniaca]|nr:hypothetical protein GBA52_025037 [Prunus armeniaca]
MCLTSHKKLRKARDKIPFSQIPTAPQKKLRKLASILQSEFAPRDGILLTIHDKSSDKEANKIMLWRAISRTNPDPRLVIAGPMTLTKNSGRPTHTSLGFSSVQELPPPPLCWRDDRWLPPLANAIKINFDGAWSPSTSHGGIRGYCS